MRDAPLVSARAAGIPKSTHVNPPVPELIPLSEALPRIGIALCCIWAAYTTTELPEVATSTVMSPEVAADAAEPQRVVTLAAVPAEAMALAAVSSEVVAYAAEPPEAAVLVSSPCMVEVLHTLSPHVCFYEDIRSVLFQEHFQHRVTLRGTSTTHAYPPVSILLSLPVFLNLAILHICLLQISSAKLQHKSHRQTLYIHTIVQIEHENNRNIKYKSQDLKECRKIK